MKSCLVESGVLVPPAHTPTAAGVWYKHLVTSMGDGGFPVQGVRFGTSSNRYHLPFGLLPTVAGGPTPHTHTHT
jgi:hypothetical protein